MGFFSKIFDNKKEKVAENSTTKEEQFDKNKYDAYNEKKIEEFKRRYDLHSIDGINNIPLSVAKQYPDGGKSVVYMPEQILQRQATEFKKNKEYDLAIACLEKANELMPQSFYAYTRDDYERVVDMMILAGNFEDARNEHSRLDQLYGKRIDELYRLKKQSPNKDNYQKTVIDVYAEEFHDREQYYWLLEHIPNIAPKSFSGFRRMKKNKSENYMKIVSAVNDLNADFDGITFWK